MKNIVVLMFTTVFLSGCIFPTEQKYQAKLDSWVNKDSLELVRTWGPPQQSYEMNGHQFLVYTSYDETFMKGDDPVYETKKEGNSVTKIVHTGLTDRMIQHTCATTFEVANNRVVGASFRGNDCSSY